MNTLTCVNKNGIIQCKSLFLKLIITLFCLIFSEWVLIWVERGENFHTHFKGLNKQKLQNYLFYLIGWIFEFILFIICFDTLFYYFLTEGTFRYLLSYHFIYFLNKIKNIMYYDSIFWKMVSVNNMGNFVKINKNCRKVLNSTNLFYIIPKCIQLNLYFTNS